MAVHDLDFRNTGVPDILTGIPVGRGFVHTLQYPGEVNVAILDQVIQQIKVPSDEHWYVLQWMVRDWTGGAGSTTNGWRALSMRQTTSFFQAPIAYSGTPSEGPWKEVLPGYYDNILTWSRWWDGTNHIYWNDFRTTGKAHASYYIVRCTDPVWSMPRWPAGTEIMIVSDTAMAASGMLSQMELELTVIRFRAENQDFKRLLQEEGAQFLAHDLHMQEHRPILGQ